MSEPFAFFGTGPIAVGVLTELEAKGLLPALVITSPDAPKGRGLALAPSPVKEWALARSIPTESPIKLTAEISLAMKERTIPVAVVVDYGMIIPQSMIDAFPKGILNMHPSLLPRLRGPSPIRSAILTDEHSTGVTVMLLDAQLDHGPIIAQRKVAVTPWPPKGRDLDVQLSREGGKLMAEMLPLWVKDEVIAQPQNHDVATYSHHIDKKDAEINLADDAYQNLLKICAYDGWPLAYTFFMRGDKRIRVIIVEAHIENGRLILDVVKPEGKGEMPYADFARSGATPA